MAIEVIPQINNSPLDNSNLEILGAQGFEIQNFLNNKSSIELNLLSVPDNILLDTTYNYRGYKIIQSENVSSLNNEPGTEEIGTISVDPVIDIESNFPTLLVNPSSQYRLVYNFYNNIIGNYLQTLFIKEISSNRTEISLDSFNLGQNELVSQTTSFVNERRNSGYFIDFHLNIGNNIFIPCVNIKLNNEDPLNPIILVKLKDPLPSNYTVNDSLFIVKILDNPLDYLLSITPDPIEIKDTTPIQGPNFNIDLKSQVNNSTLPFSYNDLLGLGSGSMVNSTSSLNQLNSLLKEKSININVDYTNFDNFIHFSSAQTRLENFHYKIELIEEYSSSLAILNNTLAATNMSSSKASFEGKISNIINNFDGYERFLYYESGSFSYPKTNSQIPYTLSKTTSPSVINWLGNGDIDSPLSKGILLSASIFDGNNRNQLLKSIPEYLRDDSDNKQYELFIDMVAQYYDNIWIYLKDITNKYNNDNRLDFGISKDLVADAIRDFGIKLYQNNFSNNDLYTAFLGLTPEGGLFPYPNMTGSLPSPQGFEYVDILISASNDILPQDDVNKSLYKRIYHNLPYLLNSKGTIPGLRALITSYGIPDTILRINEYGGKDKVDVNDWDHWQNEFNYAFNTSGSNFISSSWELNSEWNSTDNVPETLMFRFKTDGLPKTNIPYSQSLWFGDGGIGAGGTAIGLRYTGSAYSSGSYSGSIKNPQYQYAHLEFFPDITEPTVSASIYHPFYDGNWWSIMVRRNGQSNWDLYSSNKIYEGGDNDTRIGFFNSSSVTGDKNPWINTKVSYFPVSFSVNVGTLGGYDIVTYDDTAIYDGVTGTSSSYGPFSGSYQEIRYYTKEISENVFKDYVMNPYSIEGNTINSSPNDLAFRASIGGELYTSSISIHPKITGSWTVTQSFTTGNSNFYYDPNPYFVTNKEYFFVDQPVAGIKNTIGDKIRVENNVFPKGFLSSSVLSPYESILQQTNISQSYTPNINYLEVAFSPQNQINDDIMSQIGFFNIGDYIGDPRLRSSSAESYPDLDKLRDEYFQKYIKNYDLKDFIRLIKFFDNSLFKMIKDFVPARTSLASGLVIKQHLLERNKYPQPQVTNKTTIAKYPSGSIYYSQPLTQQNLLVSGAILPQSRNYKPGTIIKVDGGTGGMLEPFNNLTTSPYGISGSGPTNRFFLTQSWNEGINYISGSINRVISNQDEFYNGEFSGSALTVTTQSLFTPYPDNVQSFDYSVTIYTWEWMNLSSFGTTPESLFSNASTIPNEGEILFLAPHVIATFTPGSGISFTPTKPFLKIHKDDCNGINNRVALNQANIIKIQNFGSATYTDYNIVNKTENPNYFLYQLKTGDLDASGSGVYSTVNNYYTSASKNSSQAIKLADATRPLNWGQIVNFTSKAGDSLNYFSTSSGEYTFQDTPNINLFITSSIFTSGSVGAGPGTLSIMRKRNGVYASLTSVGSINLQTTSTTTLKLQTTALKGDTIFSKITQQVAGSNPSTFILSSNFLVTQSIHPSSSQCVPMFMEPYVTLNNYYNSDFNPTMNSIMDNRKNTIYQDIDYSQGIATPVNFRSLISGSAEKFPIPDSHYTQKSSTIPRYEGAKSTSQKLNIWTQGDTGTYGDVPSVDLLKTKIVYADWIGGYPPEHMNASGVHVQYLIDENGSIKIPNTSENSLEDVQQNFESKNKLIVNSTTIGTGEATPLRDIIRGGSRIEPILYTQYGHSPALWNVTASFSGDFVTDLSTINSYEVTARPSVGLPIIPRNTYTKLDFNTIIFEGGGASFSNSEFIVTQAMLDENVSITVNANVQAMIKEGALGAQTFTIYAKLVKERGGVVSDLGGFLLNSYDLTTGTTGANLYISINRPQYNVNTAVFRPNNEVTFPLSATLGVQSLQAGDKIYIQGKHQVSTPNTGVTGGDVRFIQGTSKLLINQNPIPSGNAVSSSGTNTIWGYPTNNLIAITASNPVLNQFYGRGYKMNNTKGYVTGSGFGTVSLDWELKIGDEFRFEGNESNTFMVKKVYGPSESDDSRISQTGSLEVQFNNSLPSASINLDHFLIRRYVPDASQIIIKGFKPTNAVGPYIIKPEYVTSKLNKGVDDYILNLTNKGLI